jgi:long-chain acyl-CoA synthetase
MTDNKTIIDYFIANAEKLSNDRFLTQPMGDDACLYWTYSEVLVEAKKMASYIDSLKLPPKSQIAIMSKNCSWWIIADLAIWMTGHVSVPVYPTLTAETTKYILEHSESKLLFVGKLDDHPWAEMKAGIPAGMPTISFPLTPKDSAEIKWKDIVDAQEPLETSVKRTPEEMATIIYTSGSTGM